MTPAESANIILQLYQVVFTVILTGSIGYVSYRISRQQYELEKDRRKYERYKEYIGVYSAFRDVMTEAINSGRNISPEAFEKFNEKTQAIDLLFEKQLGEYRDFIMDKLLALHIIADRLQEHESLKGNTDADSARMHEELMLSEEKELIQFFINEILSVADRFKKYL